MSKIILALRIAREYGLDIRVTYMGLRGCESSEVAVTSSLTDFYITTTPPLTTLQPLELSKRALAQSE